MSILRAIHFLGRGVLGNGDCFHNNQYYLVEFTTVGDRVGSNVSIWLFSRCSTGSIARGNRSPSRLFPRPPVVWCRSMVVGASFHPPPPAAGAPEWGQVYILEGLSGYTPKTQEEADLIAERIVPRLQHGGQAGTAPPPPWQPIPCPLMLLPDP